MSEVRVGYSGLISFATGIMMVFTGLAFTVILTRNLSPEEFGTWNLILGLIIYGLILEPIISYWSTRETARNIQSQKTSVFFGGLFSLIGIVSYIVISYFVGGQPHVDQNILFFGVVLIPLMFINRILNAINIGWKPQVTSYATLGIEITKVLAGLILIYFLNFGIVGAILTLALAQMVSIFIQIVFARNKIRNEIKISFLKRWLKFSWVTIYPTLNSVIARSDIIIFIILSESMVGLALFSASIVISSLTTNSMAISSTVYPKLLGGGKQNYLQGNFTRLFYFGLPLAAISITFAKPGLFTLNPIYEIAFLVVIILTVRMFFRTINQTFNTYLLGIETVDKNTDSSTKDFIKSDLFRLPSIRLIHQIAYYVFLIGGLLILKQQTNEPIILVTYWAIVSLINDIPYAIHLYLIIRKKITLRFEFNPLIKYFLTSLGAFGFVYFLTEEFLVYTENIFVFIPNLGLFVIIGIGIYVGITYIIDLKTRELVKGVLSEIKK
jgi:O-antigen/teichoic acid export membrane protein